MAGGPGPFATRLRALRERAALTQEELAERAGLTSNAVGALERGERRRPYPHTVRALATALGLDESDRAGLAAAARPARPPGPEGSDPLDPTRPNHRPLTEPAAPLLGRAAELADILKRVRGRTTRLLTLTGPGGVGKTRLALAAAAGLRADFPDGLAVAELAPVRDPLLVLPTVATALGLPQVGPGDLVAQVSAYLGDRRPLLVLDNLEHVLAAAAAVADLLARCPGLTVLATSRAPLRVRAEQELPLLPLGLPDQTGAAAVAASPAGQMFLDRARAAAPAYAVTASSAPAIAEICRRLDGLPLALELAAAHARLLDPATLLARLDQAVGTGRSRELPERQRTMAATLDWSHALLTRAEQALLRRLSVFAGGFTLAAVEVVAGEDVDVFPALAGLVEQSLVVAPDEHGRYRLLEPVRQYAAGHLTAAREHASIAARHAEHFAAWATAARRGLRGPEQGGWLDRLHREHANLRAAVGVLLDRGDPGRVGRLLGRTWLYWALRGHAGEGLRWAARVADRDEDLTDEARAAVQTATAALCYATGDIAGLRAAGSRAIASARAAGEDDQLIEALILAGSGAAFAGDLTAAGALAVEAEQRAAALDDDWIQPHAGSLRGQILILTGDLAEGRRILDRAERQARRRGSPFTLALVLNLLAEIDLLAGADAAALDRFTEATELAVEVDVNWTLVYTVPGLAGLAVAAGLPELALRLYAAGAALAEANGLVVSFPPDIERTTAGLAAARAAFDPVTADRAWASGRSVPLDQLPELAEEIRRRLR